METQLDHLALEACKMPFATVQKALPPPGLTLSGRPRAIWPREDN
jgi:hypothetical protein